MHHVFGLLGSQPPLALEVLPDLARTERNVARQDRHAVLEDVHVRRLMADVDEADDPIQGIRIVVLEGVVECEYLDVDDDGVHPCVLQQANLVVHQLPLGRDE